MSTITSKLRQLVGANGEIGPVQATWNGAVVAESDRTEGRGQPLLPARRREERPARSHPRGLQPRPAAPAPGQPGGCAPAASLTTSPSSPARASSPAFSGRPPPRTEPFPLTDPVGEPGRRANESAGTRDSAMSTAAPQGGVTLAPRASRQHETGPWGHQSPHHQTDNADTEPGAQAHRPKKRPAHADLSPCRLDKPTSVSAVADGVVPNIRARRPAS